MQETETKTNAAVDSTTYVQVEPSCPYCAIYHEGVCSLVLEMEYYEDGAVRCVKFIEPLERERIKAAIKDV